MHCRWVHLLPYKCSASTFIKRRFRTKYSYVCNVTQILSREVHQGVHDAV
jgi:hypothetical protein